MTRPVDQTKPTHTPEPAPAPAPPPPPPPPPLPPKPEPSAAQFRAADAANLARYNKSQETQPQGNTAAPSQAPPVHQTNAPPQPATVSPVAPGARAGVAATGSADPSSMPATHAVSAPDQAPKPINSANTGVQDAPSRLSGSAPGVRAGVAPAEAAPVVAPNPAPRPGDPAFVGPVSERTQSTGPVPGDPGFIGPVAVRPQPTGPRPGDPGFIGPVTPVTGAEQPPSLLAQASLSAFGPGAGNPLASANHWNDDRIAGMAPASATPGTPITPADLESRRSYAATADRWYESRATATGETVRALESQLANTTDPQQRSAIQDSLDVRQATLAHIDALAERNRAELSLAEALAQPADATPGTAPQVEVAQQAQAQLDATRTAVQATGVDQRVAVAHQDFVAAHAAASNTTAADQERANLAYEDAQLRYQDARAAQTDFIVGVLERNAEQARVSGDPIATGSAQEQLQMARDESRALQLERNALQTAQQARIAATDAQAEVGTHRERAMEHAYRARIEADKAVDAQVEFAQRRIQALAAQADLAGDADAAAALRSQLPEMAATRGKVAGDIARTQAGLQENLAARAGDRNASTQEMVMGGLEMVAGVAVAGVAGWTGVGVLAGAAMVVDGSMRFSHGMSDTINNETTDPMLSQIVQQAGVSRQSANRIDLGVNLALTIPAGAAGSAALAGSASRLTRVSGMVGGVMVADSGAAGVSTLTTGQPVTPFTTQAMMGMGLSRNEANWAAIAGGFALPTGGLANSMSARARGPDFLPGYTGREPQVLSSQITSLKPADVQGVPAQFRRNGALLSSDPRETSFSADMRGSVPHPRDMGLHALSQDSYKPRSAGSQPGYGYSRVSEAELAEAGIALESNTQVALRDPKSGMRAEIYENAYGGDHVLAFAGTRPTSLKDWVANLGNSFGLPTRQYRQAIALARAAHAHYGDNLVITGHSLGGGQSSAGAMATGLTAVNFNSAGIGPRALRAHGIEADGTTHRAMAEAGLIRNYQTTHDIVTDAQNGASLVVSTNLDPRGLGTPIHLNYSARGANIPLVGGVTQHLNGTLESAMQRISPSIPFSARELSRAATMPDRTDKSGQLSLSGRALQKHSGTHNGSASAFETPKGNKQKINAQAKEVVDDILANPAHVQYRGTKNFGPVFKVFAADGRGMRYSLGAGKFIGFLEPSAVIKPTTP